MMNNDQLFKALVNSQSAMKSELLGEINKLKKDTEGGFGKINVQFKKVNVQFKKVNQRIDSLGKQINEIDDDAPTNDEFNSLKSRVFKVENSLFGFTLVELLVVMAILGVLVTMIASGFRSSQARGRDAQRKSDLKQISSALELYYSDYSKYPDTLPSSGGQFTDGKTIYMKTMPDDPVNAQNYFYRLPDSPANQKYQLFARLENTEDKDINTAITQSCGGAKSCNFAITSANTNAIE